MRKRNLVIEVCGASHSHPLTADAMVLNEYGLLLYFYNIQVQDCMVLFLVSDIAIHILLI
jgi:hypothetical protein